MCVRGKKGEKWGEFEEKKKTCQGPCYGKEHDNLVYTSQDTYCHNAGTLVGIWQVRLLFQSNI